MPLKHEYYMFQIITYDPNDPNTYPSVCVEPTEVKERFGFVGGEHLLFDSLGNYYGQLVKQLPDEEVRPDGPETEKGGLVGQQPY